MSEVHVPPTAKNKYLTFEVRGETYGIEILDTREIIGVTKITRVPNTPDYVLGVINKRGQVLSVVDLGVTLGMPFAEHTTETCIIVISWKGREVGLLVDRVSEVIDISESDVDDSPTLGGDVDTEVITGIGLRGENMAMLLDVGRVIERCSVPEPSAV